MAGEQGRVEPGRWQRRILRAVLPGGLLLLATWILWIGLPAVMGTDRADLAFPQAALGLVTSVILIATGYGYRRSMAAATTRDHATYNAGRPHPFVATRDSGLVAFASGGGSRDGSGDQLSAVATTNRYQRLDGCAVPGCGRPASAEIHAPAEV